MCNYKMQYAFGLGAKLGSLCSPKTEPKQLKNWTTMCPNKDIRYQAPTFRKHYSVIACVTNNGWMSKPLYIEKGIRQGCPLSALLFLLVAEVLAEKIRTNRENGMKIQSNDKTKYIQISQLADDTTLFLQDEKAVTECLNIVEQFGKVSGLKLNKEKTEGLWVGRGQNRTDTFAGINWGIRCILWIQ